jgi:hypothetical protein
MKKNSIVIIGIVLLVGILFWAGQKKLGQGESATRPGGSQSMVSGDEGDLLIAGKTRAVPSGQNVPDLANANYSVPVMALLGLDGKEHNYSELLAEINTLDYEIAADDVAAVREMLDYSNDQFPDNMRPIEINAVKNDVLDKLLRQKQLPEGLGLQLVEMAGDKDNDSVWRDYCIQFMQPFYERALQEVGEASSLDERTAIHDAMFRALDERDATLAGTSLIGLELLSRTHDEFDREMIIEKAAEIAADESTSTASRMTALRMSSLTGADETTADTARAIAQTGETVLLRSAAIVTLGEVGSEGDRELLKSYIQSDNQQIASAAKLALEKMNSEASQPANGISSHETTSVPQSIEKRPPVLIN